MALVPASIAALKKAGFEVMIERGAGERAGFPDSAYEEKGGQIAASRADVFAADVVLQVRASDFALMRRGRSSSPRPIRSGRRRPCASWHRAG